MQVDENKHERITHTGLCQYNLVIEINFVSAVRCAADGTGIMFLNEAALGKEHHITMDNHTLTSPPSGYDSIIAKGRVEPGDLCCGPFC